MNREAGMEILRPTGCRVGCHIWESAGRPLNRRADSCLCGLYPTMDAYEAEEMRRER